MKNRLRKPEPDLPPELARFHPTNPAVVAYRQALGDPEMAPLEHWVAVAKFYDSPSPTPPPREEPGETPSASKPRSSLLGWRRAADRSDSDQT